MSESDETARGKLGLRVGKLGQSEKRTLNQYLEQVMRRKNHHDHRMDGSGRNDITIVAGCFLIYAKALVSS
jgi:hypothetical protein